MPLLTENISSGYRSNFMSDNIAESGDYRDVSEVTVVIKRNSYFANQINNAGFFIDKTITYCLVLL